MVPHLSGKGVNQDLARYDTEAHGISAHDGMVRTLAQRAQEVRVVDMADVRVVVVFCVRCHCLVLRQLFGPQEDGIFVTVRRSCLHPWGA